MRSNTLNNLLSPEKYIFKRKPLFAGPNIKYQIDLKPCIKKHSFADVLSRLSTPRDEPRAPAKMSKNTRRFEVLRVLAALAQQISLLHLAGTISWLPAVLVEPIAPLFVRLGESGARLLRPQRSCPAGSQAW